MQYFNMQRLETSHGFTKFFIKINELSLFCQHVEFVYQFCYSKVCVVIILKEALIIRRVLQDLKKANLTKANTCRNMKKNFD